MKLKVARYDKEYYGIMEVTESEGILKEFSRYTYRPIKLFKSEEEAKMYLKKHRSALVQR